MLDHSDDPITKRDDDALGRVPFADRAAQLIQNAASSDSSTVFGLVAPWGSGKTSLLNLISADLTAAGWRVVEFNPWEAGDLTGLITEFMTTIASLLPDQDWGKEVRKKLASYTRKIAPFTSLGAVVGIDPSKAVGALADTLDDQSLAALRGSLTTSLAQLKQPIVVLVDDIDRLQSDELLQLLKLVRLIGRFPNVHYLIAYDERTVLDVLDRTDLGSGHGDRSRALSYLEKIVQVRLDVPPVHRTYQLDLTNRLLTDFSRSHPTAVDTADDQRLASAYAHHLEPLLRSPRQIIRFFSQLDAYWPLVREEVDFIDFLLITLLRVTFPALYSELPRLKAELTGQSLSLRSKTDEEKSKQWSDLVDRTVASDASSGAQALLAELFVPVTAPTFGLSSDGYKERAARQRVGSPEYFDRYFYLHVTSDDISDRVVRAVLDELIEHGGGPLSADLLARLSTSAAGDVAVEATVDKLVRFSPVDAISARRLLPYAAQLSANTPDAGMFGRSSAAARRWFEEMLAAAALHSPEELLDEMLAVGPLVDVAWAVRRLDTGNDETEERKQAVELLQDATTTRVRKRLDEFAAKPLVDASEISRLVHVWRALDALRHPEPSALRDWFSATVGSGQWTLEDVAAVFVTSTRTIGETDYRLSGFDHSLADELVGLVQLINALDPQPSGQPLDQFHGPDDSIENRRLIACDALARLRDGPD